MSIGASTPVQVVDTTLAALFESLGSVLAAGCLAVFHPPSVISAVVSVFPHRLSPPTQPYPLATLRALVASGPPPGLRTGRLAFLLPQAYVFGGFGS